MSQPGLPANLSARPPPHLYFHPPRDSTDPPRRESSETERVIQPSNAAKASLSAAEPSTRGRTRRKERRRRGARTQWKKLLWVRQSLPDNYTDASTFLDHLVRNPKLQPYEFWRLVADSTVIVQHVCSVAIFVCCFTGIFQERISPITVVSWGSACTVIGWITWEVWVDNHEEMNNRRLGSQASSEDDLPSGDSFTKETSSASGTQTPHAEVMGDFHDDFHPPPEQWQGDPLSNLSPRNQQRLITIKSAALIYCAVLGLSPILKSLTKSTTSDSIWAISCWLMFINVFFFDYGGGVGAKFPASLSTNASLMASTVLASRLTSTTHVFSLTLFSIQVFGLFPVFRRHLLHISRTLHYILTFCLVLGAGGGVAVTVGGGSWTFLLLGCTLGLITAALTMGGASWWLIGLQKWKDEIVGPWDAARPRLRRRWA
ncbi:GPI2-domain-containing protein [Microthyrium microscopicum]|uniref:GPI2-domain-containing protein n=1 Tax=Microthyrium microscopicum TaxID=703497 RepID=A0A6A6UU88_9PEZI|nr:GPI2-domain-containing protein [Microthyrium microscopicum]